MSSVARMLRDLMIMESVGVVVMIVVGRVSRAASLASEFWRRDRHNRNRRS